MQKTIHKGFIQGSIAAPASKSSMQRACAAALLHKGTTYIHNAGISNDDKAALHIIQKLGATITFQKDIVIVQSNGIVQNYIAHNTEINCGESGLSIRMFAPIAAIKNIQLTLTGEGSLQNRPMAFFKDVLPQLGVSIQLNNNKLPLQVTGPLIPQNINIDGTLSSQFLTGLLFAFASIATEPTTIFVSNLNSKPYIDLTLDVLCHFGHHITNNNYQSFTIHPTEGISNNTIYYQTEADWSSASFLLVAAAITGSITLTGMQPQSTQADKKILDVLQLCGAAVQWKNDSITVHKKQLNAFVFDATDCPDLFPPLVALASYCTGKSIIKGTGRLASKESNRALTLQQTFATLGVNIELIADEMHITSPAAVVGGTVSSQHDHRIAMAAAVAALGATAAVTITEAEAINKSYPQFFEHLNLLCTPTGT